MAENKINPKRIFICTAEEWLNLKPEDGDVVLGSPENALIRPKTKNLIEAPEKCFKTTFALRLMLGLSCGTTVYPRLPVAKKGKVLYMHGELSNAEIKERTRAAVADLNGPFDFLQGKALDAHLVTQEGRRVLESLVEQFAPEHLVLDPWQSFISGCDENSFKEISAAETFCNKLVETYGVTLWVPIHLGKNASKGARGHSSIGGWRDTRIALTRDTHDGVAVTVEPRWAEAPPRFHLRFDNGTLRPDAQGNGFNGQTATIRTFVESKGGKALKAELVEHLRKGGEAGRKAIERAVNAHAIIPDGEYVSIPLTPETEPETKPN